MKVKVKVSKSEVIVIRQVKVKVNNLASRVCHMPYYILHYRYILHLHLILSTTYIQHSHLHFKILTILRYTCRVQAHNA